MTARPVRIPVALPAGESEVSGLWADVAGAQTTVALAHWSKIFMCVSRVLGSKSKI